MKTIIENVILSGRFELSDILKKIDTLWIQGDLTDEDKDALVTLAREKATPENSYAPLQDQINDLFEQVKILTETMNANAKGRINESFTSDFYTGSDAGWCADRCSADNG